MPKPKSPAMFTRRTRRERMGLNPSEHTEAVRFMRVVRLHEKQYPALLNLSHVPMGGWRHRTVARKLKAEGVRPGYPDYLLDVPLGGYHGWRCELKSRGGTPTKEQKEWHERLRANGYKVDLCKGWEEAWAALKAYLDLEPPG